MQVPYRGPAGAFTDILGGQISTMFIPIHVGMPHVKTGRLKALAAGSAQRHPAAPDLPTLQELGVKGAEVDMWYGFMAPKGTRAAVINKLDAEIVAILAAPELKTSFGAQGMQAASSTPAEFAALMRRENARWAAVIKKNNIAAE